MYRISMPMAYVVGEGLLEIYDGALLNIPKAAGGEIGVAFLVK